MSNMKDYMMWLDDRGIATWDNGIGELIIPEGVNVYAPELVDEYKNDHSWFWNDVADDVNPVEIDEDDDIILDDDDENGPIEWDDDDDDVSNISLSAIQRVILVQVLNALVEPHPDRTAVNGFELGTDELVHMWELLQEIQTSYDDDEEEEELHNDDLGDSCVWSPDWHWFTEDGGLTGDAYNFLYNADVQGELI